MRRQRMSASLTAERQRQAEMAADSMQLKRDTDQQRRDWEYVIIRIASWVVIYSRIWKTFVIFDEWAWQRYALYAVAYYFVENTIFF